MGIQKYLRRIWFKNHIKRNFILSILKILKENWDFLYFDFMGKKNKKSKGIKASKSQKKPTGKMPWSGILIAGILAMLLYAPSHKYQWTLDDASVIEDNSVTQKGLAGIGTHLTEHYRYGYWNAKGTLYRPISLVMFAIEWAISPDNPHFHHLINILMYGLLSALLFLLLFHMIKSEFWALLIAILFVAHPVHVEVVANIKSRDEIMATLFAIASLICWWRYLERKKMGMLIAGVLLYALAMFSKESTITLLAIFPAVAFLFFPKDFNITWKKSLLFLIPALLYLLIRAQILGSAGAGSGAASPLDNFLYATDNQLLRKASAMLIMGKYLWTLLIPWELGSDYGFNQIPITGFGDWRVLLSLLAHGGLIFLMIKYWKKNALMSFGIFFYLATISIFSNLFITIGSSYGERFLFLPSIGFLIFIIAALRSWVEKNDLRIKKIAWNKTTQVPILITALFTIFYVYKTQMRLPAWENSFTLYQTDVINAPNSAKLNYHYGLESSKLGRDAKNPEVKKEYNTIAKKHFEKAIAIYPDYSDAFSQFGLLYYRSGDNQKAIEMYNRALQIDPKKAMVYSNMGIIYFNSGQFDQAEQVYRKALEYDPRFVDALQNLGAVYATQKQFNKAIEFFQQGLELEPNNPTLNFYMGSALKDSGRAAEAGPYLRKGGR